MSYDRELALRHEMITLNPWNEWTEGSAMLPDTRHGTGYLEAVKRVFGLGPHEQNTKAEAR